MSIAHITATKDSKFLQGLVMPYTTEIAVAQLYSAQSSAYLEEQARVLPQHLAVLQQLPQQWRRASELLCAADVLSYLC